MLKFTQRIFVLLVLTVFGGGMASTALASPAHDHHNHHAIASPFHVKAKEVRPHCLLHGHNLEKPCPHHLLNKDPHNKRQHTIASDCGGNPLQNQSTALSFGTAFLVNPTFDFHVFLKAAASTSHHPHIL